MYLASLKIDLKFYKTVIDEEQMRYIKNMEIPKGIGLNT